MKNNELFKKFLKYEHDNKLFDIEYKNIKIWETLRTYLYIDIEQIYNNLQPLFSTTNKKSRKQITINTLKNSLKLFFIKNKDLVFINNPRRVKQQDGKYYCIYTDLVIDNLKDNYSCITLEDPYWALSKNSPTAHFEPIKTEEICYLDFIEYLFKIKKFFYKKFNKKEYLKLHNLILEIEKNIEKEFNCDLSKITMFAEDKVLYVLLLRKTYERIIKRLNPKAILEFYDVFPSKILINKIAKEKNIPVIELQHGIVTKRNPIFLKYYDQKRKYDCLPDYVLSYGDKLLNKEYMPIPKKNIFYTGSTFLTYKKNEYKEELKKQSKKYILFISQSNLGKYISDFASEVAKELEEYEEYQIIYKMHPYEIGNEYEKLQKKNITIINNREKDLYYYQSISLAQVGIYSTGIYEGLNFNLPTFIINNNYGTEELKEMLKGHNLVKYINTPQELCKNILNIDNSKSKKIIDKYWAPFEQNKIQNCIEIIIKQHKQ